MLAMCMTFILLSCCLPLSFHPCILTTCIILIMITGIFVHYFHWFQLSTQSTDWKIWFRWKDMMKYFHWKFEFMITIINFFHFYWYCLCCQNQKEVAYCMIRYTCIFSIAIQNNNFTRNVLKIKNAIHRQKISVKAMDLILFGPPKGEGTSLLGCLGDLFHKANFSMF